MEITIFFFPLYIFIIYCLYNLRWKGNSLMMSTTPKQFFFWSHFLIWDKCYVAKVFCHRLPFPYFLSCHHYLQTTFADDIFKVGPSSISNCVRWKRNASSFSNRIRLKREASSFSSFVVFFFPITWYAFSGVWSCDVFCYWLIIVQI